MSRQGSHVTAPTRVSLSEAARAAQAGCRTREDFRLHVRKERLRRLRFVMTGEEVAWGLCVEPSQVYAAIRSGALLGLREVYNPETGAFRWRVLRSDVLALAAAQDHRSRQTGELAGGNRSARA